MPATCTLFLCEDDCCLHKNLVLLIALKNSIDKKNTVENIDGKAD